MNLREELKQIVDVFEKDIKNINTLDDIEHFCNKYTIPISNFMDIVTIESKTYSFDEFCKKYNIDKNEVEIFITFGEMLESNIIDMCEDIENIIYELDENNKVYISDVEILKTKNILSMESFKEKIEYVKSAKLTELIRKKLDEMEIDTKGLDCTKIKLFLENKITKKKFIEMAGEIC
jgi:hypothetical protein